MLETQVNRALLATHLLERAVHEPTGWTMSYGPHEVPVIRAVEGNSVVFTADFPETCWITSPEAVVLLKHQGILLATRPIPAAGDVGFSVRWRLAAQVFEGVA